MGNKGENALETVRGGWVTIVAFILSIGFSWLIYKRLETPFVNFGKKFKYQA